jgi:hydroxyacylglutathione hydrolase
MLNIQIVSCLNDNYSYIIHDEVSNLVGVIDPSEFKTIDKIISLKYKKIDYILNTHHHFDHVGGNQDLKKKYNSKIVASEKDKNRIAEIDILINDNKNFNFGKTQFKVLFTPGHTDGHIVFYCEKEKIIFTGDTLFSLGCGKVFEGTLKQMYDSLNKIKKLPKITKIYCGHEYTESNLKFCITFDPDNKYLIKKIEWIRNKRNKGLPTVPVTLEEELNTNIFLRCDNLAIKNNLKMSTSSDELIFEKLRNLKDKF